MKNAILIVLLSLVSIVVSATDYYVSSSGSDSNNGLSSSSAWQTITKVNASFSTLKPGDRILFNRGDTFYGTITISKSGLSGSPIIISAYGTGNNPIITGFTTLTNWTNEGSSIYSSSVTSSKLTNMVIVDGVEVSMGRYPDKGTNLTFESYSGDASITDNQLSTSPNNWTNAEVVIEKAPWRLERGKITSHAGSTLTYSSLTYTENIFSSGYYFIQNDLRCLTTTNEWYHNTSSNRFYIYGDPSSKSVKMASINNLFYNKGYAYITVDGVDFTGSIDDAMYFYTGANNCIVKNCTISYAGLMAINMIGNNYLIDNNSIHDSNSAGIYYEGNTSTITNNTISNIGLIPGGATRATSNDGIFIVSGSGNLVQYNNLVHIGYNGIHTRDLTVTVKNNFIKGVCLLISDGGAIYTDKTSSTVRTFEGNIILGDEGGTAEGIYLDELSKNVLVKDNTIADCITATGIKNHRGNTNTFTGNTLYNNKRNIYFQNSLSGTSTIFSNVLNNNISVAKENSQYVFYFYSATNDVSKFGTADNNYYARPVNDGSPFHVEADISKDQSLAQWQAYSGQDTHSHKSPVAITNTNDIRFYYNASKTDKVITLDLPMIDTKGAKYTGSVTLAPYTSVVLIVDPNPDQPVTPVFTGSSVENGTPSIVSMSYQTSLANIVPANSAFTIQVNGVNRSITSVSVSGNIVQLTMPSEIVYGDKVSVAYTQPGTNPLQTSSGQLAASLSAQTVTNKVNPVKLVYVSSVVTNASPTILTMTYNLSLANIVPAASAFTVMVNSVKYTVNSVSVSGTNVLLTISSPIVYGDIITVAYTQPASNPLQNSAGTLASSISAQTVTNNVSTVNLTYLSSIVANATPALLTMTYNLSLANIVPAASAFTVLVNSVARTANSVTISGTNVILTLASPIKYGDIITVAYTKPASNPLQNSSGSQAPSFSAQTVINSVNSVNQINLVYVSSVIANSTPSLLTMTYSSTLATNAPVASAFKVMVNSVNRTISSVAVSGTDILLTLSIPAVYGDVITVAYTKPSVNPIQTVSGSQAATITAQSVINNCSPPLNQPPVISITSPSKNILFAAPATVTFNTVASDADGSIVKVEFFNGNIKIGESTQSPFSYTWKAVTAGSYSITAVATDNLNLTTRSSVLTVVVTSTNANATIPGVINITNPVEGENLKAPANINITIEANDPDGTISKVEFFSGTTKLGESLNFPYSFSIENAKAGKYKITASASDRSNNVISSSLVNFTVTESNNSSEIINLYPNPNNGHFSIDLLTSLNDDKNIITIIKSNGEKVYSGVLSKEENVRQFDLSEVTSGIYILMITGKQILITKKFIKQD